MRANPSSEPASAGPELTGFYSWLKEACAAKGAKCAK